jgi:hypothetical protein
MITSDAKALLMQDYYMRALKLRVGSGLTRLSRLLADRANAPMAQSEPSKRFAFAALIRELEKLEDIERQWGEGACLNFDDPVLRRMMADRRPDGSALIGVRLIENGRRYQGLKEGTVRNSSKFRVNSSTVA